MLGPMTIYLLRWKIKVQRLIATAINLQAHSAKLFLFVKGRNEGPNSKKEMNIDSLEEISTNLLNENDTQQSPSYSIKRNEDYVHAEAVLKSPIFSAPEEFNHAKIGLKVMKGNSSNKIVVGHLKINSLRNKFEALQYIINRNLDILLSEAKLDDSFPSAQFMLKNFGILYRLDRNSSGEVLLLYVREYIPSKFRKVKSDCNIETICVEVNLRKS